MSGTWGCSLLLCACLFAAGAAADDTRLVVQQIGADNRAAAWQGEVPTAQAAGRALGLDPDGLSFDVRDVANLGADPAAAPETRTLTDLIGEFEGLRGGANNSATLTQTGARNRALQLQVGSNNRMLTDQSGSDNIAVHLHRGGGNDTQMIQRGGGNETALIAEGGVAGADGGPLRMEAFGAVKGFAVRASGAQDYSTISVRGNETGGYNIEFSR